MRKCSIQSSSKVALVAKAVTERQARPRPAGCALVSCGESILASRFRTLFSLTLHGTSFSALNSTLIPSPIAFPRGKFIRGEVLNDRGARKKSPIAGFGPGTQAVFLRRVRQSVFSHPIVKTLPLRRCGLLHTDTGMAPTPQLTSVLPTPVRHSQFQALTCIVDLARSQ